MKNLGTPLLLLALILGAGCSSSSKSQEAVTEVPMTLLITSNAFSEGGSIPRQYTCDGQNISPQLSWSGVPKEVKSLALIVDDPDAPSGTFVHWVLFNIPPDQSGLAEAASGVGTAGSSSFRKTGYGGPCPPKGPAHRYYFKLYALDILLDLKQGASKADVEKAMGAHILAQGQLMGKYSR